MVENSEKLYQHKKFYILLGLMLILIFVRYAFLTDIPREIFLGIIIIMALLGNKDEILTLSMCFIPLHESVDLFYALSFCFLVFVFKYFKEIRIHLDVILVMAMIFWELLHCLWQEFAPVTFIAHMIPFIVLVVIMSSDISKLNYGFLIRTFATTILCTFFTLIGRVIYFADFNVAKAIAGIRRLGADARNITEGANIIGGQMNSNSLGVIGVLAIIGLLQLYEMNKGKKSDILIAGVIAICGALTASRTYLACLAMMMILFFLNRPGGVKEKIKYIFKITILICIVFLILSMLFPELLEYYIGRFLVDDITTGRDDLMVTYHNFIISNPQVLFFGMGMQNYNTKLVNEYRIANNVPHNSVQELVIAWGIVGAIMFVLLIACMNYVSKKFCKNHKLINYIPLIIILFKGMAGQMLGSSYTMLAFSLAYISMCQNFEGKQMAVKTGKRIRIRF